MLSFGDAVFGIAVLVFIVWVLKKARPDVFGSDIAAIMRHEAERTGARPTRDVTPHKKPEPSENVGRHNLRQEGPFAGGIKHGDLEA